MMVEKMVDLKAAKLVYQLVVMKAARMAASKVENLVY